VHGTLHHLFRHAALARELAVPDVCVLENGELAELDADGPVRKAGRVPSGRVHVFAQRAIPASVLHEREALAARGTAHVVVPVDARGRLAGEVALATRGVVDEVLDAHVLATARHEAEVALRELAASEPGVSLDEPAISEAARQAVRRALGRVLGFKPLTTVTVLRISR
jgi:ribonuclease J